MNDSGTDFDIGGSKSELLLLSGSPHAPLCTSILPRRDDDAATECYSHLYACLSYRVKDTDVQPTFRRQWQLMVNGAVPLG